MHRFFAVYLLLLSVSLVFSAAVAAPEAPPAPTEETLLAAWEDAQRADPKVQLLESVGEREYRFETTHFPYEGRLVITEVVVDDYAGMGSDAVGFIQAKLPDAADDVLVNHSYAYSIWQRHNTLYWNADESRWLGWDEQQAMWQETVPETGWWSYLDWFWIAFLVVIVVVLAFTTRKANRRVEQGLAMQEEAMARQREAMEAMERGLQLNEETNVLLREIRDAISETKDERGKTKE